MKALKHLIILLSAFFMVAACQKEVSLETGSNGGMAVGTLKDSLANCQPISINGLYFTDSTLADSNYVIVQVNITAPGTYVIFTDAQNGFSFRDSGFFASTGVTSVKLKSKGRPVLAVTTDFTVTFGSSFCVFSIPVLPNQNNGGGGNNPAAFTLAGTTNNCTGAVVQGSFAEGTALDASNKVDIQVTVTTPGTYTITTTTTNGMTFFKSGTFTTTGAQTITLQGSGTPTTAGATQIPVSAGGTACAFTVNVGQPADINLADSAWQFTQGNNTFHGTLDSIAFSKVNGIDVLQLYGLTFATGDSLFVMGIGMTSNTIASGTYNTNTFAAFDFSDFNATTIFSANPQTPTVNIAIVLTYDPATKIAQGTFSGTAKISNNTSVPITGGKFKAKLP